MEMQNKLSSSIKNKITNTVFYILAFICIEMTLLYFEQPLLRWMGAQALTMEGWSKGGAGIIDKGIYVDTNNKENRIMFSGGCNGISECNNEWIGKSSDKNQVVFIKGHKVYSAIDDLELDNAIEVIFSADEIRYIKVSESIGGVYYRVWSKKRGTELLKLDAVTVISMILISMLTFMRIGMKYFFAKR